MTTFDTSDTDIQGMAVEYVRRQLEAMLHE
jgi:hypothetical protein